MSSSRAPKCSELILECSIIIRRKNISPLKLMTKNEVMNDLFKLDLVQKHADKERCQHCLDLLESVFEHDTQRK